MKAGTLMIAMGGGLHLENHGELEELETAGEGVLRGCGGVHRGVGMSYLDEWNEILLKTQSINGLWWVSQLCPRTRKQEPSNRVM